MSILVVDDDAMTSEVSATTLRRAGYSVTTASDARHAYEILEESSIDLLLLDVQMPGVDGIELARIIRQSREHLSLPIVFLSGERDPGRQLEARKFGGDDFIIKPVSPKSLTEFAAELIVDMNLDNLIERFVGGEAKIESPSCVDITRPSGND